MEIQIPPYTPRTAESISTPFDEYIVNDDSIFDPFVGEPQPTPPFSARTPWKIDDGDELAWLRDAVQQGPITEENEMEKSVLNLIDDVDDNARYKTAQEQFMSGSGDAGGVNDESQLLVSQLNRCPSNSSAGSSSTAPYDEPDVPGVPPHILGLDDDDDYQTERNRLRSLILNKHLGVSARSKRRLHLVSLKPGELDTKVTEPVWSPLPYHDGDGESLPDDYTFKPTPIPRLEYELPPPVHHAPSPPPDECTFHPVISDYARIHGPSEPFLDRLSAAERKREIDIRCLEIKKNQELASTCTFHPQISQRSDRHYDDYSALERDDVSAYVKRMDALRQAKNQRKSNMTSVSDGSENLARKNFRKKAMSAFIHEADGRRHETLSIDQIERVLRSIRFLAPFPYDAEREFERNALRSAWCLMSDDDYVGLDAFITFMMRVYEAKSPSHDIRLHTLHQHGMTYYSLNRPVTRDTSCVDSRQPTIFKAQPVPESSRSKSAPTIRPKFKGTEQELLEKVCTFKPTTSTLPVTSQTPKRRMTKEIVPKSDELEMSKCTFHPKINNTPIDTSIRRLPNVLDLSISNPVELSRSMRIPNPADEPIPGYTMSVNRSRMSLVTKNVNAERSKSVGLPRRSALYGTVPSNNKTSKIQTKTDVNVVYVDVVLKGRRGRIAMRDGDVPEELSRSFSKIEKIPQNYTDKLTAMLEDEMSKRSMRIGTPQPKTSTLAPPILEPPKMSLAELEPPVVIDSGNGKAKVVFDVKVSGAQIHICVREHDTVDDVITTIKRHHKDLLNVNKEAKLRKSISNFI